MVVALYIFMIYKTCSGRSDESLYYKHMKQKWRFEDSISKLVSEILKLSQDETDFIREFSKDAQGPSEFDSLKQ